MNLLALDTETHLIQPGLLAPPIVCGSFAWRESKGIDSVLHDAETALDVLETHGTLQPAPIYVGANIAYDFGCVLAVRPDLLPLIWKAYEEERVFDVLIAGTLDAIYGGRLKDDGLYLRNGKRIHSGRYSLATVVEDYLGRVDAKKNDRWRKSYALLEHLPIEQWPEDARQYPIDDAVNTLEAAEAQLKECHNLHDLPKQAHAHFCAHLGAVWGLRTDPAKVAALKSDVDRHIEEMQGWMIEQKLLKKGGTRKKPKWTKDTKVIKELVYKAYDGLPPTTEGGDISTSREALSESGDPTLEKLAGVSKWEKLRTYADSLAELGQRPMNVSCNILLNTGRASYDGLVQLMPRKGGVRECFVPRKGFVFSSVDYAAIEMSTLAQVCLWALGTSKLAEAIDADVDPHSLFAAEMTGVTYDAFLAHKKEPREKGYRQAAKACLGPDTRVLTPRGWLPIVQVTTEDRVWDGVSWVTHEGLLDQGVQETLTFAAVEATRDHGVLTGHGWKEWNEVLTSRSLFQSALDLATSPSSSGDEGTRKRREDPPGFTRASGVIADSSFGPPDTSSSAGTPLAVSTATSDRSGQSGTSSSSPQCPTKTRERDFSIASTRPSTGAATLAIAPTPTTADGAFASPRSGSRTSRCSCATSEHSKGMTTLSGRWTASTTTEGTNQGTSDSPRTERTSETETRCSSCGGVLPNLKRRSRVYDLLNAGPNHRFTILTSEGPLVVSNCNFGFPGMMGAPKFVVAKRREGEKVCEWIHRDGKCGEEKKVYEFKEGSQKLCVRCVEEATKLRQFYFRQWPEMPHYFKWVTAQGEDVEQFVSKRVRGGCSAPAAANTRFQGLAADGAKAALIALTKEMYLDRSSPLYGSRLLVFAHDETFLEIPEELGHEAAHRQAEIMVAEMRKYVPDVKVKAEPALMTFWTKEAEAKYENGRLVPWA